MVATIKGEWSLRRVWADEGEISPQRSQQLVNHSPNGFNWGYGGSGPAQFSRSLLAGLMPSHLHQNFKWKFIATPPEGDFNLNSKQIETMRAWIKEQGAEIKEVTQ